MAQTNFVGSQASGGVVRQLNNVTDCVVCRKSLNKPLLMSCGHAVCLQCGDKLNDGHQLICPTCRRTATSSSSNAAAAGRWTAFEPSSETADAVDEGTPGSCDVCGIDDDDDASVAASRTATMYCVDCQEKLCDTCSSFHSRSKVLQSHRLIDLAGCRPPAADAADEKVDRVVAADSTSDRGAGKPTKDWCCSDCDAIAAELTLLSRFGEGDDDDKLSRRLAVIATGVARCSDRLRTANCRSVRALAEHIVEVEAAVHREADRLHDAVEERRRKLLSELADSTSDIAEQIADAAQQTERFVSAAEKLNEHARQLMHVSALDVARRRRDFDSRVEHLVKSEMRLMHKLNALCQINISFEPTLNVAVDNRDDGVSSTGRINLSRFNIAGKWFHMQMLNCVQERIRRQLQAERS
jgi:Zinc finger, C3HC4 type (RING finger)/B-box zinc finger